MKPRFRWARCAWRFITRRLWANASCTTLPTARPWTGRRSRFHRITIRRASSPSRSRRRVRRSISSFIRSDSKFALEALPKHLGRVSRLHLSLRDNARDDAHAECQGEEEKNAVRQRFHGQAGLGTEDLINHEA